MIHVQSASLGYTIGKPGEGRGVGMIVAVSGVGEEHTGLGGRGELGGLDVLGARNKQMDMS